MGMGGRRRGRWRYGIRGRGGRWVWGCLVRKGVWVRLRGRDSGEGRESRSRCGGGVGDRRDDGRRLAVGRRKEAREWLEADGNGGGGGGRSEGSGLG